MIERGMISCNLVQFLEVLNDAKVHSKGIDYGWRGMSQKRTYCFSEHSIGAVTHESFIPATESIKLIALLQLHVGFTPIL